MPKPRPVIPDTEEWTPLPLHGPFGGLNLRDNPRSLVNQSPDLLNIDITEDGLITTDLGYTAFGTYSGTDPVTNCREVYKSDGTKFVLRSLGTKLQSGDGSGAWADIATGLTSGKVWDFVVVNDIVYMVNGVDTPRKWAFTGSASTVAGISNGETIDYFNDRIWTGTGSTISYSALGDYENFAGGGSVECYKKDGKGKITALRHLNGRQIVIKERQKYSWEALTLSVLAFQPIGQGTKSLRSVVIGPDGYLYFTNKKGIWRNRGYDQDDYLSRDVEPEFIAMDGSKEVNLAATWFQNEYWLAYTPSGQTVNTKVFRLKSATGQFLWKDWRASCFCVFELSDGTEQLIFGSSQSDSAIYKRYTAEQDASYNHNGAAIDSYYTLAFLNPVSRKQLLRWKRCFFQFEQGGAWYACIHWRTSTVGGFVQEMVSLNPTTDLWANDGSLWEATGDVWPGQDIIEGYLRHFSTKARGIQFKVGANLVNQPFRFLGLTPHFQLIEGFK
jgi:hypothetical protein